MKIELKNIKINLAFSEETTMFMADIYVDGIKTGYAKNDGHGGSTYYHAYEGKRELLEKAEAYSKTLPPINYGTFSLDSDLESIIDNMVDAKANEKGEKDFKKKLDKAMLNNIVWGVPNGGKFKVWGFKNRTIEELLRTPMGRKAVGDLMVKVTKELQEGEVIFNENLINKFGGIK